MEGGGGSFTYRMVEHETDHGSKPLMILCLFETKVHTGKLMSNSRTFQGLLKDIPPIFKD